MPSTPMDFGAPTAPRTLIQQISERLYMQQQEIAELRDRQKLLENMVVSLLTMQAADALERLHLDRDETERG